MSLDVLNSSWHAVSQLHLLRWMIIGAMHATLHSHTHTDSTESRTDGLRQGPPEHEGALCVCEKKCVQ